MPFKIDSFLDFLGTDYSNLISAEKRYSKVRQELLGPIKRQIKDWQKTGISPDDVVGKVFDNLGFAVKKRYDYQNIPEGFNGNQYVVRNFFGRTAYRDEFSLQQTKLRMHFRKSLTDVIEEALYSGFRKCESRFFQKLCEHLGEDFKGIFLFSATGSPTFRMICNGTEEEFRNPPTLGNWDYVDCDYKGNNSNPEGNKFYEKGVLEKLKGFGIQNPEKITPWDQFWTQSANKTDQWEFATRGNKTTRLVNWFIGENVPEEIDYETYDLTFAESDQSPQGSAPEELFKLTHSGGYIVVKSWMIPRFRKFGDRVRCLLNNPEGDFSLLQKK